MNLDENCGHRTLINLRGESPPPRSLHCAKSPVGLGLSAYKRRQSFLRLLSLGLSVTASPFAKTHEVHGDTVFDCTNAKNTIADVDLSVVEDCPDFVSTYGNATLVRTQILQRMASTLVKTYTCNLIISREACKCK